MAFIVEEDKAFDPIDVGILRTDAKMSQTCACTDLFEKIRVFQGPPLVLLFYVDCSSFAKAASAT